MGLDVSNSLVNEKLDYLHRHPNVLKKPTAEPVYKLPKTIHREIINSNFSGESIQKLSDHIGHFLGLFNSIKVTIGIESSEYMLTASSASGDVGNVGLYKVKSGGRREIQLTKKFRFRFKHIMAILVHESMHNYLDNLGIRLGDTDHNEVLTDVSAAYFGLGHHIIKGYDPIVWTTERTVDFVNTVTTTHTYTIGYVPAELIEYAVYQAAIIRELPEFVRICPVRFWVPVGLRFLLLRSRKHAVSKRFIITENRILNAKKALADIEQALLSPANRWKNIKGKKANSLVELQGIIATGEISRNFERLLKRFHEIGQLERKELPSDLVADAEDLINKITMWDKVVKKSLIN